MGTPRDPAPSLGGVRRKEAGVRRETGGVRAAAPNLVKLPREVPHMGTSTGTRRGEVSSRHCSITARLTKGPRQSFVI